MVSLLAIAGNLFGIPILTTFGEGRVDMKRASALCLLFCGLSLVICGASKNLSRRGTVAFSAFAGGAGAIVSLVMLRYSANAVLFDHVPYTVIDPSMPSGATMFGVTVFFASMVYRSVVTQLGAMCTVSRIGGLVLIVLGAVALLGHAVNVPSLFYFSELGSTGMAIPTAICFALLGSGLLTLPSTKVCEWRK